MGLGRLYPGFVQMFTEIRNACSVSYCGCPQSTHICLNLLNKNKNEIQWKYLVYCLPVFRESQNFQHRGTMSEVCNFYWVFHFPCVKRQTEKHLWVSESNICSSTVNSVLVCSAHCYPLRKNALREVKRNRDGETTLSQLSVESQQQRRQTRHQTLLDSLMFVKTIPRTERRKITIRHEFDYKMGYTYIHT